MIDGGDDETGIGQRLHGVVLLDERPAPAVRDNDQRQLCAGDRTILHALQVEIGTDRKTAQRHMCRLRRAWIPDRARQGGIGFEKLNARGLRRRAKTRERDGESQKRAAQRKSP
ncbi:MULTISPECIES: hypothetical protein [unclassified Bradyrhizobium]